MEINLNSGIDVYVISKLIPPVLIRHYTELNNGIAMES